MAGVLHAPVLDQHLLLPAHPPGAVDGLRGQPAEPAAGQAAAGLGARPAVGGVGALVEVGAGGAPAGRRPRVAQDVVVGVEHVDERALRERGVDGQAQHAAVEEVVDLDVEVGEDRGRGPGPLGHLDHPALLGHEDLAVGREGRRGGDVEPVEHDPLLEALRQPRRRAAVLGWAGLRGALAGQAHRVGRWPGSRLVRAHAQQERQRERAHRESVQLHRGPPWMSQHRRPLARPLSAVHAPLLSARTLSLDSGLPGTVEP